MRTSRATLPATGVMLAGLLLTLTLSAGQEIVNNIASPTLNLGETANLDCTVRQKGSYKLHWSQLLNNQFLLLSIEESIEATNPVEGLFPNNKTKYEVDRTPNDDLSLTYRLTINRLQVSDAGLYQCSLVKLEGGVQHTVKKNGTISLHGVSGGPRIINNIGTVKGRVSQSANLTCLVANKGSKQVKWKRKKTNTDLTSDGRVITSNPIEGEQHKYKISTQNTLTGVQFVLTVNHLTMQDDGEYQCYVQTSRTPYPSQTGRLQIGVPPTITTNTPQNVTRQSGQSVSLECLADGVPDPQIVWTRLDGAQLPSGHLSYEGQNLIIPRITTEERGLYQCKASNDFFPQAKKIFRVLVPFPPTSRPSQIEVKQALGHLATMSCIFQGYPDVVPTWYKMSGSNKVPVPTTDDNYHITHSFGDGVVWPLNYNRFSLSIQKVKSSDLGEYRCEGVSSGQTVFSGITLTESATCVGDGCYNIVTRPTATPPQDHTKCQGSSCVDISARLVGESLLLVIPLIVTLL
ncbi:lachesin-like [Liolophura sinensis]|uniref:lachesin-like n=1 Tax=Liolophura sinensis TaxID=3198878 RepID=UPI00315903C6